jgi:two-component system vancomycin resistance associated response regulator VraR
MRRCFESESGWQVCGEAASGQEAIEKAQELQPNFIILDLSMPGMNGLEAARALNGLMPAVPLVMFTSFITNQLEHEARSAGIKRVIGKSEPLANLLDAVRTYVVEQVA